MTPLAAAGEPFCFPTGQRIMTMNLKSMALFCRACVCLMLLTACAPSPPLVSMPARDSHIIEGLHIPLAAAREEAVTQAGLTYAIATHEYPSGRIRVLSWSEASGPVFRRFDEPARIFMLEGLVTASVEDREFPLAAGDAAILLCAGDPRAEVV